MDRPAEQKNGTWKKVKDAQHSIYGELPSFSPPALALVSARNPDETWPLGWTSPPFCACGAGNGRSGPGRCHRWPVPGDRPGQESRRVDPAAHPWASATKAGTTPPRPFLAARRPTVWMVPKARVPRRPGPDAARSAPAHAGLASLSTIHAAVGALGIHLEFVLEGIGIRLSAGDELQRITVALAGRAAGGHSTLAGHEGAGRIEVSGEDGSP